MVAISQTKSIVPPVLLWFEHRTVLKKLFGDGRYFHWEPYPGANISWILARSVLLSLLHLIVLIVL